MARKEIQYGKMKESERQQLVNEVNILRELRHPNIVSYYERHVDKDSAIIYIFMELCEGGDLAGLIRMARNQR
jgi:NIMA (never in mitosis gene a)-related kinase 2